jgi:hypothetical protein
MWVVVDDGLLCRPIARSSVGLNLAMAKRPVIAGCLEPRAVICDTETMRFPAPVAFLAAAVVLPAVVLSSSCAFVQTRTSAVLLVAHDDTANDAANDTAERSQRLHGVTLLNYAAEDTHPMTLTAVACIFTALFYGGACWSYAFVPFDDQEHEARMLARADILREVPCGRLVDFETEVVGWLPARRRFTVEDSLHRVLTPEEMAALCGRRTPKPPSSTPAPPPSSLTDPPAEPPPPALDPAG